MKLNLKFLTYNLLIFLFFTANQYSFAQDSSRKKISKLEFDKIVDYLNYKIIDFELKTNNEKCHDNFVKRGENITGEEIKVFLKDKSNELEPSYLKLTDEIDGLKKYPTKDIEEQKGLLTKSIYSDKFESINDFENRLLKKKKPEYNEFKAKLKEDLLLMFDEANSSGISSTNINTSQPKKVEDSTGTRQIITVKESWWQKLLPYLIGFFSGIILTLLFSSLFRPKKKRSINKNNGNKQNEAVRSLTTIKNDNYDFNIKNNTPQHTEIVLGENSIVDEGIPRVVELEVINNVKTETVISESDNVLFFPNPYQESAFLKSDGRSSFILGASIFKFYLKSDTEAEFEFLNESSSVSFALNNRFDIILAVSNELNPYNPNTTSLITQENERGKAILEGNIWRVTRKVKIKYA